MMRMFTLRTRILLAAVGLLLVTGVAMLAYINTTLKSNLATELQKRGVTFANNFAKMAANPNLTENFIALQLTAIEFKNSEPDVEYLFIADKHGNVTVHTFGNGFPSALAGINPLRGNETQRVKLFRTKQGAIYDIAVPVLKGELGTAHVGLCADTLLESVRRITWRATWLVVGLILLTSCGAVLLAASLTRPINDLIRGVDAIGRGALHHRLETRGNDEISHLERAFNRMAQNLEATTVSRDYVGKLNRRLEEIVAERTEQLSWANAELTREVEERRLAEEEVRRLNATLEQRILQRTQELEASNRELEAFCYSVSHDLRAPLRHINAYSHILSEEFGNRLDNDGNFYLHRLETASRQMGLLIDDLLQLSRVGRMEMRQHEVNLSALAMEVCTMIREAHPERDVEVLIEPGMKGHGDRSLLRLVLQNLLENAWKYTARRERAVIEFGSTNDAGNTVYFIRDNGIGFDMTHADKLFGVFQRLVGASEFPGTGIGLATVRRIIERHDGRVWAEGKIDNGATFFFSIRAQ